MTRHPLIKMSLIKECLVIREFYFSFFLKFLIKMSLIKEGLGRLRIFLLFFPILNITHSELESGRVFVERQIWKIDAFLCIAFPDVLISFAKQINIV